MANSLDELLNQTRGALAWLRDARPDLPTLHLDESIDSRAELSSALRRLYASLRELDEAEGNSDRDSGTFLFYDAGLARIIETAEAPE